jgi:hypothetical protein
VLVRALEDLLLGHEVLVGRVHLRQQRHALELVLEDLDVVAEGEGAVFREQLILGRQLAPHSPGRLVNRGSPAEADGEHQQRRQDQRELGAKGQGEDATTSSGPRQKCGILQISHPSETRR